MQKQGPTTHLAKLSAMAASFTADSGAPSDDHLSGTNSPATAILSKPTDDITSLASVGPPNPGATNLLEFTVFPELPSEMRSRIWKYASLEPRTIAIDYKVPENQTYKTAQNIIYALEAVAKAQVPGVLHATVESHHEASKIYELSFKQQLYGKSIYFNHAQDTMLFNSPVAFNAFYRYILVDRTWKSYILKDFDMSDFESRFGTSYLVG